MDYKFNLMMGILTLSSVILLGRCEEGTVSIDSSQKSSKTPKGKISLDSSQKSVELPEGASYEVVGGGYALALGKVGGAAKMWLAADKDPRVWTEIASAKVTNPYSGDLPVSLQKSFPSRLTQISSDGEKLKVTDEDGDIWSSEDNGENWGMEEFAGGDGTSGAPYQVASASHLWLVRGELDKHFQQTQDIDLSVVTEPEGFKPIGNNTNRFTGTFDGNGKKITNLTINLQEAVKFVGFFGFIHENSTVKNVRLEDMDVKGGKYIGGLVGGNNKGTITNSHVNGKVTALESKSGRRNNSVRAGGLVGWSKGEITNSHATVEVKGLRNHIGGLVGLNDSDGEIGNSYARGKVEGHTGIGGLVGWNKGNITRSYATGAVKTIEKHGTTAGGLVGVATDGTIIESYATGNVTSDKNDIGGLVGMNSATIEKSYATGNVQGGTASQFSGTKVGGLVGSNTFGGVITNSYATGNVNSVKRVGGLVGYHDRGLSKDSKIENSYATGIVTVVDGGSEVGGFVGEKNDKGTVIAGKNYWKTQESSAAQGVGKGDGENVEGKTETDLKALTASATNWDNEIWNFNPGEYPKLSWQ